MAAAACRECWLVCFSPASQPRGGGGKQHGYTVMIGQNKQTLHATGLLSVGQPNIWWWVLVEEDVVSLQNSISGFQAPGEEVALHDPFDET